MPSNHMQRKDRIWNAKFINIFIVNFMVSMGQYTMNTLIPKYAYHLGAAASVVGIVSSMFAVTALLVRPAAGPAMDYFRKSRLLSISIGLITVAFVGYGLSGSIGVIMAARLIHGIGIGVTAPLCLALASNALPEEKMASGIGVFTLGSAVATAVGPSLGLKLSELVGYNATFFVIAGLLAASFVMTLRIRTKKPENADRFRISLKTFIVPEAIIPSVIMLFLTLAYSCINFFIAIYGGLQGVGDIGLFFTAYAVSLLVSRPVSGRIADKYGVDKTVIPGLLIFAASFILISISKTLPMFILAGVVCAFGYGICAPAMQTICMQLVSKDRRGAASNANFIGVDLGNLFGPILAGLAVTAFQERSGSEVFGYEMMYRLMLLPVLAALAVFVLNKKNLLVRIKVKPGTESGNQRTDADGLGSGAAQACAPREMTDAKAAHSAR
jgi:MFS family permease